MPERIAASAARRAAASIAGSPLPGAVDAGGSDRSFSVTSQQSR
jgi:hypothetical protein